MLMSRMMYSEKEDAERVLRNGFTDGYSRYEALVIAKYYRHVLGYGDSRTKTKLIEFCSQDHNFYPIAKREAIRRILKDSRKDFKDTSKTFGITVEEIEAIKTVKNYKFQLVLLAMLAIAKNNNRSIVWINEWRNIRKITSRYITNRVIRSAITTAYAQGLIREPKDALHELAFIDNSNALWSIKIHNDKDLFNLSEMYKKLNGGEIFYCKMCGTEVEKNSNRHKYCNTCWTEKEKADWKVRKRRQRNMSRLRPSSH